MLKAVGSAREQTHGVAMDALAALEKTQPLGFDYRDVSMPVHVFHGRADHMVRQAGGCGPHVLGGVLELGLGCMFGL